MEEWTTPKQVSAAMLIMAFAVFPQILSVAKSDWSNSLDLDVGDVSIKDRAAHSDIPAVGQGAVIFNT